jgi:hypothetical protein
MKMSSALAACEYSRVARSVVAIPCGRCELRWWKAVANRANSFEYRHARFVLRFGKAGVAMRFFSHVAALCLALAALTISLSATERKDTFQSEAYSRGIWNFCQADPIRIEWKKEKSSPDTFLWTRVNKDSIDLRCYETSVRVAERLGPSFVDGEGACPSEPQSLVHQRNELRFKNSSDWHDANSAHWYTMNFKMTGAENSDLPTNGSRRWVIAQWKYDRLGPNQSPFLAQRFDNSVLHITVDDGFCRCMIATGEGGPDKLNTRSARKLQPVDPLKCINTKDGEPPCPCRPQNLKLTAYSQGDLGSLPDPKTKWVQVTYKIKAGGVRESLFEVYADGRFIVRAEGAYQENVAFPNRVKFKIGHYRDAVSSAADMLIDRVCVSQDVKNCDTSVRSPE